MPAIQTGTIPALTVCQPYASLLMLTEDDPEKKRVENRGWRLDYRGPLVIHAGQSRRWLKTYHDPLPEPMPFGVILGVVDVIECLSLNTIASDRLPNGLEWLLNHQHVEGPWCIVCANARQLAEPIPYRGAQKLWRVPRELVVSVLDVEHAAR